MSCLPDYIKKIETMRLFMASLPPRLQKLSKKTRHLQLAAQSNAIEREDKKEAKTLWNKLYITKPAADYNEHHPNSSKDKEEL